MTTPQQQPSAPQPVGYGHPAAQPVGYGPPVRRTNVLSIVALVTTGVDAGLVGFVLSYALNTTGSLVSDLAMFGPMECIVLTIGNSVELACALGERGRAEHRERGAYPALH